MDPLLKAALEVSRDTNYSFAAAITFVICDILQKFDDEVAYIWKARWSLPKILYLIARYYALFLLIAILVASNIPHPSALVRHHPHPCLQHILILIGTLALDHTVLPEHNESRKLVGIPFLHHLLGRTIILNLLQFDSLGRAGTGVCNLVVDLICILRIHALYAGSRKVFYSLLILTLGLCGTGYYLSNVQTSFPPVHEPLPFYFEISPCLGTRTVTPEMIRLLPISWILNLALASTFFFMTLFKLRDSLKDGHGKIRYDLLRNWSFVHPLFAILVVDGALVFLLFAGILGLSAFMSIYQGGFYYTPCWPWLYAMYSYSGSILILNLRRLGGAGTPTSLMSRRHGGLGRDTMGLTQITRMQFESNTALDKTQSEAVTEITQDTIETNDTRVGSSNSAGHGRPEYAA